MLFRIALIPFSYAILQCLFAIMANFIRQEISFGKKFHSTRNFIWQEISFGIKTHSVRNFIRQEISFGRKFHSARNFIRHFNRQEISFGKKFHSARNFIRHGTQKPKFNNRKRNIRNINQIWRKARELTKIVGKQEWNLIMFYILY